MSYKIAVVGVTGIVGRQVLKILQERGLGNNEFYFYASTFSVGKKVKFNGKKYKILKLDTEIYKNNLDFAIFCTKEDVSMLYVKKLAQNKVKVIDFSSSFRKKYPLIVPEINPDDIKGNIICNPNCSTIGEVIALNNIHKTIKITSINISTYQAVSGAGKDALDDLNGKNKKLKVFDYPIKNNIFPFIGKLDKNGNCQEECKIIYETRKILHDKDIKISATCVRVPVEVCHGESINFQTEKRCSVKRLKQILSQTAGVRVVDDFPHFPMPLEVCGQDLVFVGRIRKDLANENSFNIFVVSDNLRKGAAQNGVQILQEMIRRENEKCKKEQK